LLLFSVVVHEVAHGLSAEYCGDPTARMLGRITLNPLPHLDPIGSILVPLVLVLTNSHFFFAWAKPVPVNPYNFNRPRRDDILVSVAGPLSNLLLAFGFAVVFVFFLWITPVEGGLSGWQANMIALFRYGIWINLILALFNLIPIPPLDGSHILENLLPPEAARRYAGLRPYGFIILIAAIYFNLFSVLLAPAHWLLTLMLKAVVTFGSLGH
jgi:Zn-dependent protease